MSHLPDSPDLSDEIDRDERLPMTTQERRLVLTSSIGTIFQWYDFFLYGVVAGLFFNKLYFPDFDARIGTMLAFATFAVGFVARPLPPHC